MEGREALLREGQVLQSLDRHPNLPAARDEFFFDESIYCLVMDLVDGASLETVVLHEGHPGLPLGQVLEYLENAASALEHLHRHDPPVIHQEVSPSNLIRRESGEVALVDFGLAKWQSVLGRSGRASTAFVAPEIVAGESPTPTADVFGLAATTVMLLDGSPPAFATPLALKGLGGDDARRIQKAIAAGLTLDPTRRTPSPALFVQSLRSSD